MVFFVFIIFCFFGISFFFIVLALRSFLNSSSYNLGRRTEGQKNIGSYFKLRDYFFTYTEKPFYEELIRQAENSFNILSKVRLEDVVTTTGQLGYRENNIKRNYIKSKHLDFVLLGKNTSKIVCVIELDGFGHKQEQQSRYDKIKNDILDSVGVPFFRVRVGQEYSVVIKDILEKLTTNNTP
ncbi:MAG: DUF2726 domain-containing protein [Candidatus Pacebacteria bacterium]|nr:DUF2726 domain-containing protein [Candidatus Paceibacterota bacterium]